MPLAIFALRQSAQPPRLEMPTPQRSDRFSPMQPEPPHPASSHDLGVKTNSRPPTHKQAVPEMDAHGIFNFRNFRLDQGILLSTAILRLSLPDYPIVPERSLASPRAKKDAQRCSKLVLSAWVVG